jgi:DNA mismatch repair protein MutS
MSEPQSLVADYLQLSKKYMDKYGRRTIVLMQVGVFFEMYGLKRTGSSDSENETAMNDICQLCQLNTSDKKICVGQDQVVMAGFRDYSIEKYLAKITDGGYTAVVYVQDKSGKNITRVLQAIYSPGTYVSCDMDSSQQITNNIMCIWLDTVKSFRSTKETLIYGVSVVNIFTGKTYLFEHECPFYMNPTTFDELERCVSVYAPSELVVISPFNAPILNSILQYAGIQTGSIHRIGLETEKAQNCAKQTYIRHILTQFFGEECYDICIEFNSSTVATQSFCYLMDFIQEHNPNLVSKIAIPVFNNVSNRVILANHTLQQLNMIGTGPTGSLSSVHSFLNKCKTPMGKRLFHEQMTNPSFNENWLTNEYTVTSNLLENYHFVELFRQQLSSVRDLEKVARQLVLRKLYPASLYHMYHSISAIKQLDVSLCENPAIRNHFTLGSSTVDVSLVSHDMIKFLDKHFDIESCKSIQSLQTFEHNIIKPGISTELDKMVSKQQTNIAILYGIQDYFNKILEADIVKKHETEKSCISLQLTKKRGTILKAYINNHPRTKVDIGIVSFDLSEVKLVSVSANADEISIPILNSTCKDMFRLNDEIDQQISIVYNSVLAILERDWLHNIELIGGYVARMDVAQSKAYIARTYNYCKPEIANTSKKSFARAQGIRHCLIEHIQTNELYVTNDIHIGCDQQDGMLLYGTNAVGKTSLIRALGISVILAQCGMYVPCSSFVYKPYTAIYSRILGNDNLFKGLSTFAVEMSELRVILKMADANSLVLGDEICSGTETESALSIFVSALMDLSKKDCSFIFATHFHEIIKFDEVKKLMSMVLCHMAVTFDREKDCLIYDRKLKPGPGNRMYGLEVCKSLYLEEEFLNMAYLIRNKYFPDTKGELSHGTAVYNAKKVRGFCEVCKSEIAGETHHINEQKDANADGFIDSFHKNHPANLLSVCEKCHDTIHATSDTNIARKKTTAGYRLR